MNALFLEWETPYACAQGFKYQSRSPYSFVVFVDIMANPKQMRPMWFQLQLRIVKKSRCYESKSRLRAVF